MKISVVMVDGSFRENVFGARCFAEQRFPSGDFEVLWIEHFDRPHADVERQAGVRTICLGRSGVYHSSYCFNRGIAEARGEVVVIPDADQIVRPDFLGRVWDLHSRYDRLAVYGYRYDEVERGTLADHSFAELEDKCVLKNPTNFGGCLTVRRRWLLEINGYEQHPLFQSGNHANGLDVATRFKNLGLAIQWEPSLRLYHPWHPFTLQHTTEHLSQEKIIGWRRQHLQVLALEGIDPARNQPPPERAARILGQELRRLEEERRCQETAGGAADSTAAPVAAQRAGAPAAGVQELLRRLLGGRG